MYRNHVLYKPSSEQRSHLFFGNGNSLGIGNPTFIWDHKNNQLILIMDTNQMMSGDVRALLKGNSLILEAPLISSYNKPFRTHLLRQENRDEVEEGLRAIEPKMIKVVLGFSFRGGNRNN